ncbi:branched-chain amino acid ABC transporter permease [Paracraurococcus lichenis]|uniref:Branched-chain amino acid ABC transporter permease n=1 Tax=Paracraurococcus lichenis TaxID=3064888 RepID=A0ABT9E2L9_9PROT|nr:branched-chain amino acid ABC transporter permease [Paracraurococcus sp. LOR1-02]MDO9710411.1 branched-chain amino acid ABC transporter permease [Paracraurococcus sp. LOR1-02]
MEAILQYLLTGLSVGSVYAMVGLGFYVMWSAAKAVNFNFGDIVMLGAVLTVVQLDVGMPLPVACLGAVLAAGLLAAVIERGFVRPFNREANAIGWMLTTIAVGTMIESATTALFGSNPRRLETPLVQAPLRIGGSGIYPQELLLPVALVLVAGGLEFFYRRTVTGRAMRAVAYNRTAAGLVGIDADRMTLLSFGLAGLLGALSGVLIGPVIQASATMGAIIGLKGFLVAIIAGIANARGVVIAGVLYGVSEKFIEAYLSTAARDAIGFSLMVLLLLLFPHGLFGKAEFKKV